LLLLVAAATFQQALPGYHFNFPRDHASHNAYKTEWWYYTGHLEGPNSRRFGFELTFFRFGLDRPSPRPEPTSRWRFNDLHLSHFALTDEQTGRFRFFDRLMRPGMGLGVAREDRYEVRTGSWLARLLPDGRHHLRARDGHIALDLVMKPLKAPVIHGHDGVSRKADCEGCASHYYSLTRLETSGIVTLGAERLPVHGQSWMDHEFGSNQLTKDQTGWDWFSLQLKDGSELMLYRLRKQGDQVEKASSGTFVRKDGSWTHLPLSAWKIEPTGSWKSPHTQGTYPMGWHVTVPAEKLDLTVTPVMNDQELVTQGATATTYWEGAVKISGNREGLGYVEMTGYAPTSRPDL
jgi:predicted secreted hydrolase